MRDGFDSFCAGILSRALWPGDLPPAELAREFVHHFGLTGLPRLQRLEELVKNAGVGEIVATKLPDGLRGAHFGLRNGHYTILYNDTDWQGAREHTVLHETYEILQEKLSDLCPSYRLPKKSVLCRRADRFATAALMEPEMFTLFAETTGLDVLALQKLYRRSYASIALRLTEVMRSQAMMVAIYDRREEGIPASWPEVVDPGAFIVSLAAKTPGFPAARSGAVLRPFRYPAHLIPRKTDRPVPGSAAYQSIEWGRSVYVERVRGYDLWGLADLTVLAQPVRWHDKLAKVVVVAVPWRDKKVLKPQLSSSAPVHIEGAFQVL